MKRTGAIFALMTIFLVLPYAALSAEVPGVTDTEVVVGISTPLSGPAALGASRPGAPRHGPTMSTRMEECMAARSR